MAGTCGTPFGVAPGDDGGSGGAALGRAGATEVRGRESGAPWGTRWRWRLRPGPALSEGDTERSLTPSLARAYARTEPASRDGPGAPRIPWPEGAWPGRGGVA